MKEVRKKVPSIWDIVLFDEYYIPINSVLHWRAWDYETWNVVSSWVEIECIVGWMEFIATNAIPSMKINKGDKLSPELYIISYNKKLQRAIITITKEAQDFLSNKYNISCAESPLDGNQQLTDTSLRTLLEGLTDLELSTLAIKLMIVPWNYQPNPTMNRQVIDYILRNISREKVLLRLPLSLRASITIQQPQQPSVVRFLDDWITYPF